MYSAQQTKKLKIGVVCISIVAITMDVILFICNVVFFTGEDLVSVRFILIVQYAFHMCLSITVVVFFVVWLFVR